MLEWIETLAPHWLWLILGLILATAEIIIPGFFLIWLAGAAIATGVISFIVPIPLAGQVGLFAILSVIAVYAARRWLILNPIESTDPKLNDRGARLIGDVVTVVEAIGNGEGRIKVGDSVWSARGAPANIGDHVRIIGSQGSILIVEMVKAA
jgi:inner membrane protein